ncbi:MAG: ABC transporter permease, partial [Alphaproteobacteria bacterium]|nr:ABC transporter permease [Alphaproteobacteria bacterium]
MPALVLILVLYVGPLLKILGLSFTDPSPGLQNYRLLLTSGAIQRILLTTVRICALTTVLTLAGGYLIAYALVHANERLRQWMLFCVLLPFWLSVLVRSFAWVMLLRQEGVVNSVLLGLGLIGQPLTLVRNEFGVIVGMIHYMLPYAILPLYTSMQGIDQRLVAAARGLGAGPFDAFRRVFLPLSLPGLIGAGVLVFVFSLGFYITPAILGGGKTVMIAEYIAANILDNIRWGLATMLATVLLATVFLLLGLMWRVVDLRKMLGAA